MAVAPDFHTDFLTVEHVRHAHTPTTPSRRGGIIFAFGYILSRFCRVVK